MAKGLFMEPERLYMAEYKPRALADKEVRIRSEFSAIKHGTDFFWLSGKTPFHDKTFDDKWRLFLDRTDRVPVERLPFGNMTVGTVIETGQSVSRFKVGDRVYTYGPIAETVIAREDHSTELLQAGMTEKDAVCMDPAFYAYAAVRDANVKVGDHVAVFGLGAIGLFVIQLLRLNGCMEIVGIDPIAKRRELAEEFGATLTLDSTACDVGLEIRHHLKRGTDAAIVSSGSYRALQESMRAVQACGTVVSLGYYHGRGQDLMLGQEWHHNRLTLISSMPVWGNPLRDAPLWDNDRLNQTLQTLFTRKMLSGEKVIDPVVHFDEAAEGIMEVYKNPNDAIKTGVRYS